MKALLQQALTVLESYDAEEFVRGADVMQSLRAAIEQGDGEPVAPTWNDKSEAMLHLNTIESMLGGANGPTIRLRALLQAAPVSHVPLTKDEIKQAFDDFIEFPDTERRSYVTTTSTLLFAERIASIAIKRAVRGDKP